MFIKFINPHIRPRQSGKTYWYMNDSELALWREHYKDDPKMQQWLDDNVVLYERMPDDNPPLIERLNDGLKKDTPTLNRADRRTLRKRKTQ